MMGRSALSLGRFGAVSVLLLVVLVSCSPHTDSDGTSPAGDGLKGTIRVSGAWALYPMMVTWGEEFTRVHPDVRIDVSAGGAGKGMADVLAGLVDIGMVSREIKQEETDRGAWYVPVVRDAVFPMMNSANPVSDTILNVTGMKREVFAALWAGDETMTWGDISGTTDTNDIQVYTRSDSCGAAETWAKYLGMTQEDLKGIGVYGDPGLAEAVKKDAYGIGYNNLNYAFDAKTGFPVEGLRIIPIDINENGMVDDDERLDTKDKAVGAVAAEIYPAPPARDLNLVCKERFSGPAKEFVRWILTDGQDYVDEVGYISLSESKIAGALEKVEK
jgi:phosphate transport system substrate-binding protein